ncbi:uncharacterized protein N7484_002807 [Penicillium longicatenatum]|uniref:uncharacterized protein n=1 Tax=Penicillium longicatenatum TaxID=1561947 RepID=UPI0025490444|nr:uncharacterized protein N7484_002807 [Penicillium longicatenatum]KAJ5649084.1 hypothetical protein N7484_002807 [Penicillium longicatenatum]
MPSEPPGSFSEIPPKATGPWKSSLLIDHGLNASGVIPAGSEDLESSAISPIIISPKGDLILEYVDPSSRKGSAFWQVSLDMLVRKCSYFRALLDLNKFSEGANLAQQLKAIEASTRSKPVLILRDSPGQVILPVIGITANSTTSLYGADVLGLFLKIICLESMDESVRNIFINALKLEPPSVVAGLVQVADSFNAPDVLESVLRSVGYQYGKKGRSSLCSFSTALLKINEDRLRQIALISKVLKDYDVTRVMTHTLILLGSKYWHNGPHLPKHDFLLWQYLPDQIEEELYYRRRCIMATIADLQSHFLRAYGVLEDVHPQPSVPAQRSMAMAFATPHKRHFQCRAGLSNGSECDIFQVGQLIRFFVMRSKTVFLGSNLIDPEFTIDPGSQGEDGQKNKSDLFDLSDIITILTTLKEFPDYQVDANHGSCGIKRRIIPIIPCIENFLLNPKSLIGLDYGRWFDENTRRATEWKTTPKAYCVDIRQSILYAVHESGKGPHRILPPASRDARLLFTAHKRNWEA